MEIKQHRIRIWDLPARLFHWLLVTLLIATVACYFLDAMNLHMLFGQSILTLIIWRIMWGFVGSETARFSNFLRGWPAVRSHLRHLFDKNNMSGGITHGHNPLGGWAVILMLVLLLVQTLLGLFASDDILTTAPLAHLVNKETSHTLAELHETNFFFIILPVIIIHIAASFFYLFAKKQNLITPMITGDKTVTKETLPPRQAPLWLAALCLAIAAFAVYALTRYL
jgi:cytochrome b